MAFENNQNDFSLPDEFTSNRKSTAFLPKYYRTDSNNKFLNATLDQLIQPGKLKKVNGYIGRQNSKATTANDIFVEATDTKKQNYQLEPSGIIKDSLDNVTFVKDYLDFINQIDVLGGITNNHRRINKQESYSWDPQIDWDKFVNYQQYYWLPYGPASINVVGQQQEIISTYTVVGVDEGDNIAYLFTPNGLTRNPLLTLYRGQTYRFNLNVQGHPFSIKTERIAGDIRRYNTGVSQQAVEEGVVEFTVPHDAPNVLYYVSENDANTGGVFQIQDILENTFLDVEADIIGKSEYVLPDGTSISNGMKLKFAGNVVPAKYSYDYWYVEGVGQSIQLINSKDLEIVSAYSEQKSILFDDTAFDILPFDDASAYAQDKDYITINRASLDKNPWTRYNRWFHKNVIETAARLNDTTVELDQVARAKRPIIEFKEGLKLFNFGTVAKKNIDLIDTFTVDAFSTIEGSLGYNIDGVDIAEGHRILFTADTDKRVNGRIFQVKFINVQVNESRRTQVTLIPTDDSEPIANETVLVKLGSNQGKMYFYNQNLGWQLAQQKIGINQEPLFDVFDSIGNSFGDNVYYDGTTFQGTKIFSYKRGQGVNDSELGFPLSYRNISNIGDIVFNFNLLEDTFNYKTTSTVLTESINIGYLFINTNLNSNFVNGWVKTIIDNYQPIIRIFKGNDQTNNFYLDVFDNINDLDDLTLNVYINGKRLAKNLYTVENDGNYKKITLSTDANQNDVITVKCLASQAKNQNGYYEVPISFQNNPLNNQVVSFTLGQIIDHVDSIVDLIPGFNGEYPGNSNLRDLGYSSQYGYKFVQHSGPGSLSLYHVCNKNINAFKAIEEAREDYGKFKRNFIRVAESLGFTTLSIRTQVDEILNEITKDKSKNQKYYLSDMVPFKAPIVNQFVIQDSRIKTYPLSNIFSLTELSNKAVLVYYQHEQLTYQQDYTINSEGFVVVSKEIQEEAILEIIEYATTDGSFVPATPTKLGLYPKFAPKKYLDTSYIDPTEVVQGHDGSITIAYGDYRDDLLLELEKRIFNNIKIDYDPEIFSIHDIIPGYNRKTEYSLEEFNQVLRPSFYQWLSFVDTDFARNTFYRQDNSFTWNYSLSYTPDGANAPGFYRGVYRWLLDTDRPNICPWECLGFSIQPDWWEEVYGPAPYTSNNLLLWEDLSKGIIRQPGQPVRINKKYLRPYLTNCIPVNEDGDLLSPKDSNSTFGPNDNTGNTSFIFGDVSPVESAWRRSSYYPFSLIQAGLLMYPNVILGKLFDRSRIQKNLCNQLIYSETNLRIRTKDAILPSIVQNDTRNFSSGIVNWLVDQVTGDNRLSYDRYTEDLKNITFCLTSKLEGFTSKEKFKLLLDSKNPASSSGVFVPSENYNIILNSSSPVKKVAYSGVIIFIVSRNPLVFQIKGYSQDTPYFNYYLANNSRGKIVNIGGISETYSDWARENLYIVGQVVRYQQSYYRVVTGHTSSNNFDPSKFIQLDRLPIIGGKEAVFRTQFSNDLQTVNYGATFYNVQEVVDFLLGYGNYLERQGFIFDNFNSAMNTVNNWETSAKEFLFWSTQGWAPGSIITLSPSAKKIVLKTNNTVVNDIKDPFYKYNILQADGTKLEDNFVNAYRSQSEFTLLPVNTNNGIYAATFYLIQKEHLLVLDNFTNFNDVIYDVEPGYRQERIKVVGYKTAEWNGNFDTPGFIYDSAEIKNWEAWTDYYIGDTVKYKEFYWSANKFIAGADNFVADDWIRLSSKPTSKLVPNWDYKAEQFTDFYDLDSSNFDTGQQTAAQHLIGYQKRQYLENIINDDVSQYKFYQGMIIEKGTQNVFNKLFDVLSADNEESLKFFEEWSIRVGQYGASDGFDEIELTLKDELFKLNPQPIELVQNLDNSKVDFVIRQTPNDIFIKSKNYNNQPFPLNQKTNSFLRSAGYVRYDNVNYYCDTLDNLLATNNISEFREGDYVWCGFEGRSWNVYRFTKVSFVVEDLEDNQGLIKIRCNKLPDVSADDIIGIINVASLTGFHKLSKVDKREIFFYADAGQNFEFADSSQILIYKFVSARIDNIDLANDALPNIIKANELLWTDNNGDNLWTVWQNNPVYAKDLIQLPTAQLERNFGLATATNALGNKLVASDNLGIVRIFEKDINGTFIEKQSLQSVTGIANTNDKFGFSLSLSSDNRWLVIGSPLASNVKTNYAGEYNPSGTYQIGDVVRQGNTHWEATRVMLGDGSTIDRFSQDWEPARLVEADITKTASGLSNQGLIYIYEKDSASTYLLSHIIVSPYPVANEQFGYKVKIAGSNGEYTLVVSAPGYNNNQGRLYTYRFSSVDTVSGYVWHMDYDRNYRGHHNPLLSYNAGDIVFYESRLYQAIADVPVDPFINNPSLWTAIEDTSILGCMPQQVTNTYVSDVNLIYRPTVTENVESVFVGDMFGDDFDLSADGTRLVVTAPNSDNFSLDPYKGPYRENLSYQAGDIVKYNNSYWVFDGPVDSATDGSTFDFTPVGPWNQSRWTPFTGNYEPSQGKVFVYEYSGTKFVLTDTISGRNFDQEGIIRFGESAAISHDGYNLAVGATLFDNTKTDQGAVFVFNYDTSAFTFKQTITRKYAEVSEKFGEKVFFSNKGKTLIVYSTNGSANLISTFDNDTTTFDKFQFRLLDTVFNSGRIDIYNKYNENYIFGESLVEYTDVYADKFGYSISCGENNIFVSAPLATYQSVSKNGLIFEYKKNANNYSWTILSQEIPSVDIAKIKKVYLYNAKTNQLIRYLDVIDPVQGRVAGIADQEIKYKTFYDPAVYTQGFSTLQIDENNNWTKNKIGVLWWDLTRAKFLESQDSSITYRNSTWNTLFDTASIDIYEWVESKYLPEDWDKLADTERGLSQNISGTSVYGNNAYSVDRKYDTVTRKFNNTYYFWVKNKKTVPAVSGRTLSSAEVSLLISDPKAQGYKFVAFTSPNSVSLFNCKNELLDSEVKLAVQFWTIDNIETNIHSQWKIVSLDPNSNIPNTIEQKWIDSLVGKDINDRVVPDYTLPPKKRYGIEFRPRQSMFVNRYEALKQVVEKTNSILKSQLVAETRNLSDLMSADPAPTELSGLYDVTKDISAELQFISTNNLRTASLLPIIVDGKITDVEIVDSGYGYQNAPFIKINGAGIDASIRTIIDTKGRITGVSISNSGKGYGENTTLSVRDYSVLVRSDEGAGGKWSIYAWDTQGKQWYRIKSQSFDVTRFWSYIDWYALGYNQFTKVDFSVDFTYQLASLKAVIGQTVKVNNVGIGGWLLLEKYADGTIVDYTTSYRVIGRQNGTIALSDSLYYFIDSPLGFDGSLFDSNLYDNNASIELRIILESLKNHIFVDDLKRAWLEIFFTSLRYVLYEQYYVDWLFKTSFIKAQHNVGDLKQKTNYNNDNLENFEDFVNEVKPYRTKIREYISQYSKVTTASMTVTDFDLPPTINRNGEITPVLVTTAADEKFVFSSNVVETYPWKYWLDNVGFIISSIEIVDGGSGYVTPPVVKIEGDGTGALAQAYIANGKVNRIVLYNNGTGYTKTPSVTLDGGLRLNGVAARVVPIMKSEVVRSMFVGIKFDRTSGSYYVDQYIKTENFTGTGSRKQFVLQWVPDIRIGKSSVYVNGQQLLREEYSLERKTSTSRGYTYKYGVLTLASSPAVGDSIQIEYYKDVDVYNAIDRVKYFYEPTTKMLGKDISQIYTGIDYGGVSITGLGFGAGAGWDALPWFSDQWDGFDAAFDDYLITVDDSTYTYTLPYTPALGQEINVYVNGQRIDDPYFDLYDGSTIQPNGRTVPANGIVMKTIVGDGVTNTYSLPNLTDNPPLDINQGDKIIFRKSTSDGSFLPNENEYDTILTGGDLSYSTATGIAPEDIILDGDGFVTPMTSHAPEEVVPGQIVDTVAIKVFARPSNNSAEIKWLNYKANGCTCGFPINQFPNSLDATLVKVAGQIKKVNIDYTLDWDNKRIQFASPPAAFDDVAIASWGFNGNNILDIDYFVGDGSTVEFITKAPWVDNPAGLVLVNGNTQSYDLFRTDTTYISSNRVGIRFSVAPNTGEIVNYVIQNPTYFDDSTVLQTTSLVKKEIFVSDGSTQTYYLNNILGANEIYENNTIVRVGQTVLRGPSAASYVLADNVRTYALPQHKFGPYQFEPTNVRVYRNGLQLAPGTEFVFNYGTVEITLSVNAYREGEKLVIIVDTDAEYSMNASSLTLVNTVLEGVEIEVTSFYNHDVLDIERTEDIMSPAITLSEGTPDYYDYNYKRGGKFTVRRPAISDSYIWISRNGELLSPSVDYRLLEDRLTIEFAENLEDDDRISIIAFSPDVVTKIYSYMQFKDMLNRVTYKRLRKTKQTFITRALYQKDVDIIVDDGSILEEPNPEKNLPGVVEIMGERIEYFAKDGNRLSRLRRGTMGTGAKEVYASGTLIIDIGPQETIPYKDEYIVETFVTGDSSGIVPLNYIPNFKEGTIDDGSTAYTGWYRDTIPEDYGQCDELEVFVGGFRLKKAPFIMHDQNIHPESPDGDQDVEAEFSVNIDTAGIRLTNPPEEGTKVVIVKKLGKVWNDPGISLANSDNNIANFIKQEEGIWPL